LNKAKYIYKQTNKFEVEVKNALIISLQPATFLEQITRKDKIADIH